ncbi:MAG: hypothetical protein LUH07_15340 [Lachnospiraceae bacterium]|nr:hypothetical protein [Lachnospiraceae bacterium]
MEQNRYIGPISLTFSGEEDLVSRFAPDDFCMPQDTEYVGYTADLGWAADVQPKGDFLAKNSSAHIYRRDGNEYRYYYLPMDLTEQVFGYSVQDGHTIHVRFQNGFYGQRFYNYVGLEHLLLGHQSVPLHSASVLYRGQTILFSAPSETGKSTQADLWKKYRGAEPFNGDRNLLWKRNGEWVVTGFPCHGTSPDCVNTCAPLRAIVVLRQAKTDCIRILSKMEKTLALISEMTINRWNSSDQDMAYALADDLVEHIDIIGLDCTMEQSAVETLENYLEKN